MSLLNKIRSVLNKRSEEKNRDIDLENEIKREEEAIYKKEYRRQAIEAAKIKAKLDATRKVGLAKLRAVAKQESLESKKPKTGFLGRLSEYTQANLQRREAMIQRTAKLRSAAKQDMERRKKEQMMKTQINLERARMLRERQRINKLRVLPNKKVSPQIVKRSNWY